MGVSCSVLRYITAYDLGLGVSSFQSIVDMALKKYSG